ncbi:MAG: hypothetical protein JSU82_01515 [Rhodospirillales bacterium]|nr:MAG: hypothetical protein JSU82_01515 [Rhodospirillales bacterium]
MRPVTDSLRRQSSITRETSGLRPAIDRRGIAAIYVALTIAALVPLFLVDVVPLANMPNHMARVRILAEIAQDPVLALNYRLNWGLQPNLALDLLLTPLAGVLPPLELGRWFTALTMLVLIGGTLALHRTLHGQIGLWPTALFLFLYNHVLAWGFLNFLLGLGLAMWLFAAWIATEERAGWRRSAAFGAAGLVMFFAHLMALGIYGLLVAAWELARNRRARTPPRQTVARWTLAGLQFVPPAILLLIALPPSVADPEWVWGEPIVRLRGIWSPVLTHFGTVDLLLAIFVLVAGFLVLLRRWARPAAGMGLPLLLLTAAALAAPFWTYGRFGGVWGLDVRLWVALSFVAIAALSFSGPRQAGYVLAAVMIGLFVVRIYQVSQDWRQYDRQIAEYRSAAAVITPGARVLQVQARGLPVAGEPGAFRDLYYHFTSYTVLDRRAFLPTLFTDPAKQPIVAAPALAEIDTPVGWPLRPGELVAWADPAVFDWFDGEDDIGDVRRYGYMWQDRFDFVVYLHDGNGANPAPALLRMVADGSFFSIFRTLEGGCSGDYPATCRALRASGRHWRLQVAAPSP